MKCVQITLLEPPELLDDELELLDELEDDDHPLLSMKLEFDPLLPIVWLSATDPSEL